MIISFDAFSSLNCFTQPNVSAMKHAKCRHTKKLNMNCSKMAQKDPKGFLQSNGSLNIQK